MQHAKAPSGAWKPGGVWQGLGALAVVLSMVVGGIMNFAPTAEADVNTKIKVEITKLIVASEHGVESAETTGANVGSFVNMYFTWDATDADPKDGDSFTIALPSQFNMKEYPQTKPLDYKGETVGSCTLSKTDLTCTLNDKVEGEAGVKGSGMASMKAIAATTETTTTFTVNGTTTEVTNPAGKPIAKPEDKYSPYKFEKTGIAMKAGDTAVRWRVFFNGNNLAEMYGGINNVPETITIVDEAQDGLTFSSDVTNPIFVIAYAIDLVPNWKEVKPLPDSFSDPIQGDYSFTVKYPGGTTDANGITTGKTAHIEITSDSWRLDQNYVLYISQKPTSANGSIEPGRIYTNKASVEGRTVTRSMSYIDTFVVTVTMEEGFGSFKVAKNITGDAASTIPAGKTYTVNATWEYPNGKSRADYPATWTEPANPIVFEVEAGKTVQPQVTLPVGSKVTFTETLPTVAGVTWGTPVFSPATVIIANKTSTAVTLTNTATTPTGSFKVKKVVAGDYTASAGENVTVAYTCGATTGELTVPADGTTEVQGPTLPMGTECTLSETGADRTGYNLTTTYSTTGGKVTIAQDANPVVTVTNTYSKIKGGLAFSKVVDGDGSQLAPASFTINYTCRDANDVDTVSGNVVLNAGNGYKATVADVPEGTCTVSEADATVAGTTLVTTYSVGDQTTTGSSMSVPVVSGATTEVGVKNSYTTHKVSVGDYVWFDANGDGLQDGSDVPLKDVTLTISRTDGQPVTDPTGNVIATTTTTDADGKYSFTGLAILPAGVKYEVAVTNPRGYVPTSANVGTDTAKDSSTGSAQAVELPNDGDKDLTLDFGFVKSSVSVGDYVWFDTNKDGIQDADEPGIDGVTLTITRTDGQEVRNIAGDLVNQTTTATKDGKKGYYSFDNLPVLPDGVLYEVTVTAPEGYVPTKAQQGSDTALDSSTNKATARELVDDGDRDPTLDFGFIVEVVSVGDYVWWDFNEDGLQDVTDRPLVGIELTISRTDGAPVRNAGAVERVDLTETTDAVGKYMFTDLEVLPAGTQYVVTVTGAPEGFVPTKPGVGADRGVDSSTDSATSTDLTTDGAKDLTLDFGFVKAKVSVGDYVWFDANGDGLQDASDVPLKGVTLTLTGPDGGEVTDVYGQPVAPVVTDEGGKYLFKDLPVLPAGKSYTVSVSAPFGYTATTAGVGADRGLDSSTGSAASIADLSADGAHDPSLDFGFVKAKVSVGDYVWLDLDKDGIQDADEKGLEGVTLTLTGPDGKQVTDVNGNVVAPVKTDASGKYSFDDLPVLKAGEKYRVTVTAPAGYSATKAGAGSDRAVDSSTGFAESADLVNDGDRDPTLDFGFVKDPPAKIAKTGADTVVFAGAGSLVLLAGLAALMLRRRRS